MLLQLVSVKKRLMLTKAMMKKMIGDQTGAVLIAEDVIEVLTAEAAETEREAQIGIAEIEVLIEIVATAVLTEEDAIEAELLTGIAAEVPTEAVDVTVIEAGTEVQLEVGGSVEEALVMMCAPKENLVRNHLKWIAKSSEDNVRLMI
mmetsp:Transcript_17891/g.36134  ORF Transcript_17891/g.36134 Transcript_17891/m.36134 type:complete len:147 (-) Transcript_17891:318-758(-)